MEARRPSFKLQSPDRASFFLKQTVEIQEKRSKKSKKSSDSEAVESTPIRRHAKFADQLADTPSEDIKNLSDVFQHAVKTFGDRPGLGTREKRADGTFGEYKWLTWAEVGTRVKNFTAGLRAVCEMGKGDKLGIYSKNRTEWIISMEACNANGFVTVALYDTFGAENLTYVVNHSELTTVVGSIDRIQNLLQLVDGMKGVKHIITLDYDDEDKVSTLKKLAKKHGIKLHTFAEVEEKGAAVADKKAYRLPEIEKDHLSVIMYTSGTTGNPKGAMVSHGNVLAMLASVPQSIGGMFPNDVYISYLPLAHIFERVVASSMLFFGGRIGFYQGDVAKLTEDMQVLKPTLLAAAPRVLNRIYQKINDGVDAAGGLKKKLFKMGLKNKSKSISHHKDKGAFDFVFKKPKSVTGGNLRLVVSGSAPLTPEVQSFVRNVLGCPVIQGYGLTETCAGCSVAAPDDVDCVGEVGPMIACSEVKLVSCPELNYFAKDNKGEIWIRGPNVCKGYYKEPEKTKEDFDADGWFHTGDIGAFTERGTLKIIDRKKNIFKLSQGEYVAAEVLENIYLKCPYVDQIWVHGDSTQSSLVAVININKVRAVDWAEKNGVSMKGEHPYRDLCNNDGFKKAILATLADMARAEKRQGFEIVKRCHLIDYEFSAENDFATPTAKLKRPQLRAAFKAEIEAMYKDITEEEAKKSGAATASSSTAAAKGKEKDDGKGKGKDKSGKKDDGKGKAKGKIDNESSEESSEDEPAKKPAKDGGKSKPKNKKADSESDGDEPSSSEDAEPAKKDAKKEESADESSEPKKAAAKKDESSDDSSSEAAPAKKSEPVKATKKAAESSDESSTEEAPAKKTEAVKPADKKAETPKAATKPASSVESSEPSEEEKKPSKKSEAAKPAEKKETPKPAKKAADSDSETSSESEERPAKKAAAPEKKAKKAAESSSSESDPEEVKKPAQKSSKSK